MYSTLVVGSLSTQTLLISYQFSLVTQSCPTLCDHMDCSTPGLPVYHHSWSLPKLMSIESVMPSNHLIILQCPIFLPFHTVHGVLKARILSSFNVAILIMSFNRLLFLLLECGRGLFFTLLLTSFFIFSINFSSLNLC